jgi:fructosamine-3-kinase
MSQDLDISWQVLRRIVCSWAGESAELAEIKPLAGGCVNTTLAITTADGRKCVLKITAHRVNRIYQDEAMQLVLLSQRGVPVPKVYDTRVGSLDDPFSYVLMEFVDGFDLAHARQHCTTEQFDRLQAELASMLVRVHELTAPQYGRVCAEPVPQFDSWPKFYQSVFDSLVKSTLKIERLPVMARKTVTRVHERLDRLIAHDDVPRLVHWDLWSTNILARQGENGDWHIAAILDPCCKFAHVEAELAYLELFKTVTPGFMKTYQQTRRLGEEYHRLRKPVYQLYSLMGHYDLFGPHHLKPLLDGIEKVALLV